MPLLAVVGASNELPDSEELEVRYLLLKSRFECIMAGSFAGTLRPLSFPQASRTGV